jgi:hypothetical protein
LLLLALSLTLLKTHGQEVQGQRVQGQPAQPVNGLEQTGQTADLQILRSLRFPDDVDVSFTQRQLNPLLKRVSSQSGVMMKSVQGGLIMRVTEPRFEERILNQGMLTLRRESRRNKSSDYIERHVQLDVTRPSHLVLLALEALLNGRLDVIEKHFQLEVVHQSEEFAEQWQVTLTPRAEEVKQQLSALHFYGREQNLTRFRSERHNARGVLNHWLDVKIQPPPSP